MRVSTAAVLKSHALELQPNLPRKLVESRSWQRVEIAERKYHKQPKILGSRWEVDPRLLKTDTELQFAMAINLQSLKVIGPKA